VNAHNIIIGGIEIGFSASHEISQTYEPVGGRSTRRLLNGAALLQHHWAKLNTTIQGSGRLPEGLAGLDYTAPIEIKCLAPRSIFAAGTSITLPASRRTDRAPVGYAIVNGNLVRTAISIATNTATLTAVSGASGYLVAYYPILTVYAAPPRTTFDGRGPIGGWELIGEEI
jgi:hypothetical protein